VILSLGIAIFGLAMFRYLHLKGLSVSMHEQKFRVLAVTLISSICFIADAGVLLAQAVVPEMGDTPEFVWTFVGLEAFPCFCVVHVMGPRFFRKNGRSSSSPKESGTSGTTGTIGTMTGRIPAGSSS